MKGMDNFEMSIIPAFQIIMDLSIAKLSPCGVIKRLVD
jgi:hypothetical protein